MTGVELATPEVPKKNEIRTFWQQANIDLSRGLDFAEGRGSVFAQVTHLQHAPFEYKITVCTYTYLQLNVPLYEVFSTRIA